MEFASYVPLTPEATNQSAAPSAYGTPLLGNGTPIPITRYSTPTPSSFSVPKSVSLTYGEHMLTGQLYFVSTEEYLNGLFPRFFDILPSAEPSINEVEAPFVLIHPVQGLSWVDSRELPALRDFFGAEGQRIGDHFIAVTDDAVVWENFRLLGKCELDGTFTPPVEQHSDIILALPCLKSLPNPRESRLSAKRNATEYPPVPVAPSLYRIITKIRSVLATPSASASATNSNGLTRKYINDQLGEILDPKTQLLSQQHPLWKMRSNLALWKMAVWNQLCYKSGARKADKEAQPMPETYYEEVFEDKRERRRIDMPGGEQELWEVDEQYYSISCG
ncbi:hypothetical protein LTR85_008255 [Meristemomyces frigidus]|nr:hypothetical protein LTR85_008255 [Meristemomyces frigidus]